MIPVGNLYYMLLYAWGYFRAAELRDVGHDESPNLPHLLALVLNDRIHRLLRQGLDRGYVSIEEETRAPRGRLLFNDMVKRQTLLRGLAVCEYDELTPDVLHNRILLETILRLAGSEKVEAPLRHELRLTASRMSSVSRVRLTGDVFRRVQLSRNTAQYGLLMHICELLFHELMPDSEGASYRFRSIADDEIRMAALFEEFLRKFYDRELPGRRAASEIMRWEAEANEPGDLVLLPVMHTDITIRSAGRVLVVDAKYYPRHLVKNQFGGERLISEHLYQLAAYLAHVSAREPGMLVEGMLLYPQTAEPAELRYRLLGKPVTVATVDLSADWKKIQERLIYLATV
jgi:5-methylcytosine-specific restriction enzyme subunit McrC